LHDNEKVAGAFKLAVGVGRLVFFSIYILSVGGCKVQSLELLVTCLKTTYSFIWIKFKSVCKKVVGSLTNSCFLFYQ
jgi:hypothetical protein